MNAKTSRPVGPHAVLLGLAALAALSVLALTIPELAAAAPKKASDGGGSGWLGIGQGFQDTIKQLGIYGGTAMTIIGIAIAWATQSAKAVAFTLAMAVVAAIAVSGALWTKSEETAKSFSDGASAPASAATSGG